MDDRQLLALMAAVVYSGVRGSIEEDREWMASECVRCASVVLSTANQKYVERWKGSVTATESGTAND